MKINDIESPDVAGEDDVNGLVHTQDEVAGFEHLPSFDYSEADKDPGFIRSVSAGVASVPPTAYKNLGTVIHWVGEKIEEGPSISSEFGTVKAPPSEWGKSLGARIRNLGVAMVESAKQTLEEQQTETFGTEGPSSFPEKAGSALGSGAVNLLTAIAGGGIGLAIKGATGAAVGAAGVSTFMQGPEHYQQLRDAGFTDEGAGWISTITTAPIVALDMISLGSLTKFAIRPAVAEALSRVSTRQVAGKAFIEGALSEGLTETGQNVIKDVADFSTGIKTLDKDAQHLLEDYAVTFVTSSFLGGVVGTGFALRTRRKMVEVYTKANPSLTPKEVAQAVNRICYAALDETTTKTIRDFGLHDEVSRINRYIDEAQNLEDVEAGTREKIEITTAEEATNVSEVIADTSIEEQARIKELSSGIRDIGKEMSSVQAKITGKAKEESILKLTKRESFVEEMGREPREGELGAWAVRRVIKETASGENLLAKWDAAVNVIDTLRAKLVKKISDQPGSSMYEGLKGDLDYLQWGLEGAFKRLVTGTTPDKGAFDELVKFAEDVTQASDRIADLDEKATKVKSIENQLVVAEQAAETAQQRYASSIELLDRLKSDPLSVFLEEKGREPKPEELSGWVAKKTEDLRGQAQDFQTELDRLNQTQVMLQDKSDRIRSGQERVSGRVMLPVSQLRSLRIREGNRIKRAFKAGKSEAVKEAKAVRRVVRQFLSRNRKLPERLRLAAYEILNSQVTEKTLDTKIAKTVDTLNDLIAQERIEGYRDAVRRAVKALQSDRVAPRVRVWAEHLNRVMRGQVPSESGAFNDTEKTRAGNIEWLFDNELANEAGAILIAKDFAAITQMKLTEHLSAKENLKDEVHALKQDIVGLLKQQKKTTQESTEKTATINPNEDTVQKNRQRFGWVSPIDVYASMERILDSFSNLTDEKLWQGRILKQLSPRRFERIRRQRVHSQLIRLRQAFVEKFKAGAYAKLVGLQSDRAIEIEMVTPDDQGKIKYTKEKITKGQAMTVYFLAKQPDGYASLIENNTVSKLWLDGFMNNPGFNQAEIQMISDIENMLLDYAQRVAPLYEEVTGEVFQVRQAYFPFVRYLEESAENLADPDNAKVNMTWVERMLNGTIKDQFQEPNSFKRRGESSRPLRIGDAYQTMQRYIHDAEHFIAFARYAQRSSSVFQDPSVASEIQRVFGKGAYGVITRTLKDITSGGAERQAAVLVDNALNRWVRDMAVITLMPLKTIPRQFLGFAVAIQKIGLPSMIEGIVTLPAAIRSGDLDALRYTDYMITRHAGASDFFAQLSRSSADAETALMLTIGAQNREGSVGSKIRATAAATRAWMEKARATEAVHAVLRFSQRYGDRGAALLVGWATYKKYLKTPSGRHNPEAALAKAIEVIDNTQQTMDMSALPPEFNRASGLSPLLTLFGRFNAQYVENYAHTMSKLVDTFKKGGKGRVSYEDILNTVLTYHVIVPFFEAWLASAMSGDFEDFKDEWAVYGLSGPAGNILLIGDALRAAAAYAVKLMNPEAVIDKHLFDVSSNTIVETTINKTFAAVKTLAKAPDFDSVFEPVEAAAVIATPILRQPVAQPMDALKAIDDYLTQGEGTGLDALRRVAGYSESAVSGSK